MTTSANGTFGNTFGVIHMENVPNAQRVECEYNEIIYIPPEPNYNGPCIVYVLCAKGTAKGRTVYSKSQPLFQESFFRPTRTPYRIYKGMACYSPPAPQNSVKYLFEKKKVKIIENCCSDLFV